MKKSVFIGVLVLGAALVAGSVQASLLATEWNTSGDASLYSLNLTARTATLIGSTGQDHMIGLVVDSDSTIYTITEEANSRLWTLDPLSGAATLVGSLGFNLQEGDMTIDPVSGAMYVSDGAGDALYKVDKTTGATTLVGSYGLNGRDVSGLQFIGTDLYGLALKDGNPDVLITVDPLTAAATLVGATGTGFGVIAAMGRDPATGITYLAGPQSSFGNDNLLYSVDLTTGAATLLGDLTGFNYSVSGFSVSGSPDILTTPDAGATSLMLAMGFAALLGLKKKLAGN